MSTTAFPGRVSPAGYRMGGRMRSLVRGRAEDPAWARPALIALLVADRGRVSVEPDAHRATPTASTPPPCRPATKSWKAFFFGSLDSSNFITVDKPPASLWVMALSGRIFGF